ncbi:hypothetical protein Pr1d_29730 [Bythopirellula goksoeyrii]|uniref:PEP-CTERM protein-sorting domain-containing protein n=1 Tax=Bythopirellula goksoeyrii TaxID=1400387 RepID=A0A5B9QNH8_9BACT|nr:hypothetical protein Pr1d_29730 [Bythopirellula goksoeyrii]
MLTHSLVGNVHRSLSLVYSSLQLLKDTVSRSLSASHLSRSRICVFGNDFAGRRGPDFDVWQTAYGTSAVGDADGDGDSDGSDFLIWQREFGSGIPLISSQIAVPEPRSTLLLAMAGVSLAILWSRDCTRGSNWP